MGASKAQLVAPDGRSFVSRLMHTCRAGGVDPLLVVGREADDRLRAEVEAFEAGARFVVNRQADTGGQLSSLLAGLDKADRPGIRAVMVVPVDAPMITNDTVSTMITVFSATGAPVVRARYQGKHGHPVIFSRAMFDDLRHADPAVGAKAVLRAHEAAIVNVDVDDPGVIGDIDTPDDYKRLLEGQR